MTGATIGSTLMCRLRAVSPSGMSMSQIASNRPASAAGAAWMV
jgi:hypothetical protein